ncbi:DUF6566 family protein [Caballeronia sp. RCC_10]|uniref:DUF6566 family protein n=1 Tax=Caballeronia sp. RCC_10 TaxID=3239227 RepID=UPI00352643F9
MQRHTIARRGYKIACNPAERFCAWRAKAGVPNATNALTGFRPGTAKPECRTEADTVRDSLE